MAKTATANGPRTGVLAALQHQGFRRLWSASALSGVAYMTVLTARGWVAFDLHHLSSTVGLVVFASFLPSFLVTPFTGVLADRYDRRTLLLLLHAVGLLSTLGLAGFVWAGLHAAWPLVALSFVSGASRSSSTPVEQALLPHLVPERGLLGAVSLLQANLNGARLAGPLLAAPLLEVGGGSAAFLIAAAFYVLAIAQVWSLGKVARERGDATRNPLEQFAQGVRYAVHAPLVAAIILLVLLHCALAMGFDAALPRLAADVGGASGTGYSLLVMAIGAGSLVGAFGLATVAGRIHRGQLLLATSFLSGLALVPLGYATSWVGALVAAAALGLTQSMFIALATTALQVVTVDTVRGRVLALYWGTTGGVMGVGNLVIGPLADAYGVGPALAVPGLAFVVVTGLTLAIPPLRAIYGHRTVTASAGAT